MLSRIGQRLLLAATVISFTAGVLPASAVAAPSASGIAAQQAAVDRAVAEYQAAERAAQEAAAFSDAASARLDALVTAQAEAQARLESHVAATYRLGDLSLLEVVMDATDFAQLANRWYFLRHINGADARLLAEVKAARKRTETQAKQSLERQAYASRRLRALEKAAENAKAKLAGDKAAYAEYQRRIARPTPRGSDAAAAKKSGGADVPQVSGTGAWLTGVASHYGRGSYGHRTADGTRIGPDSMIVAHKTLPFGTLVEFEYNGRHAVGRVADRGPYTAGRDWDLGPGLVQVLGFNGVHEVRYRIIGR